MAETKLEEKFPTCGIKVKPHIESAMKRLRSIYAIIYDMVNQSGFGWDEERKMIKVESDEVWKDYVKSHPNAKDFRYAPIPLFDKLAHAFGKDRATGKESAPPADNVEEIDKEEEERNNDEDIEVEVIQSQAKRKQSSLRLCEAANRLAVGKEVFDDSRKIMNELKKMNLTEQERFVAADKILSEPHRLHIFWGSDDVDRLAFVKSLSH
ncbi:hypothetical protein P8452_65598 [Trifolium repens]|nr:hypothetical protein P8452_65598 [Trifolium repens]